ncbi:MAG: MBL fold metallo-hydrolase [Candidatus Bathyarchaeia archaeon]
MRNAVKIGWLNGLHVQTDEIRLIVDPTTSRLPRDAVALISHAHADHTQGFNSPSLKISTAETRRIFEALTCRNVGNFREMQPNSSLRIGDVEVEALNSGHMIGAVQFRITTSESVILYTGDINYVDSLTVRAAEPRECDVLVMEATYGSPIYSFPSRSLIYSDMVKWALEEIKKGRIPCFRVYAAGKAQEIVKLFNEYTRMPVFVDPRVDVVNNICNDDRLKLSWDVFRDELYDRAKPFIYVTSGRHRSCGEFSEARATGWALRMRDPKVAGFPLSGHADFNQLSRYVEDTGAKRVYLFTGFTREFSEYIKRRGLDSEPIPWISQRDLWEYV